jgi:hypothetical protein
MSDVLQGLFYRGTDSGIWTRWRNEDGSWSDEKSLGGVVHLSHRGSQGAPFATVR